MRVGHQVSPGPNGEKGSSNIRACHTGRIVGGDIIRRMRSHGDTSEPCILVARQGAQAQAQGTGGNDMQMRIARFHSSDMVFLQHRHMHDMNEAMYDDDENDAKQCKRRTTNEQTMQEYSRGCFTRPARSQSERERGRPEKSTRRKMAVRVRVQGVNAETEGGEWKPTGRGLVRGNGSDVVRDGRVRAEHRDALPPEDVGDVLRLRHPACAGLLSHAGTRALRAQYPGRYFGRTHPR